MDHAYPVESENGSFHASNLVTTTITQRANAKAKFTFHVTVSIFKFENQLHYSIFLLNEYAKIPFPFVKPRGEKIQNPVKHKQFNMFQHQLKRERERTFQD